MTRWLRFDNAALTAVRAHAERAGPEECCGILIGRSVNSGARVTEVRGTANVSRQDRTRRYQIDPDALVRALLETRQRSQRVLGFYHSHPDGTACPSVHDCGAAWNDRVYVIVGAARGGPTDLRAWIPQKKGGWRELDIRGIPPAGLLDTAPAPGVPFRRESTSIRV